MGQEAGPLVILLPLLVIRGELSPMSSNRKIDVEITCHYCPQLLAIGTFERDQRPVKNAVYICDACVHSGKAPDKGPKPVSRKKRMLDNIEFKMSQGNTTEALQDTITMLKEIWKV